MGEEGFDDGESAATDNGATGRLDTDTAGTFDSVVRGNLSFVGGIIGGGIAYAFGLVLTAILFFLFVDGGTTEEMASESLPGTVAMYGMGASASEFLSGVGMPFYNAHGALVHVTDPVSGKVNLLVAHDFVLPPLNFFAFALIPAGLLFVFGGLIALVKSAEGFAGGAVSGASVLMGYLPLVLAGALFFGRNGEVAAHIQVLPAILLAGIVFPLLFGGLGGLLKVSVVNVAIGGMRERM